jgi:hypothetical protein
MSADATGSAFSARFDSEEMQQLSQENYGRDSLVAD